MKKMLLHTAHQPAVAAAAPRPKSGYPRVAAPLATVPLATKAACIARGTRVAGSWSAIRTSMTVPAFHDRWPLCSTT